MTFYVFLKISTSTTCTYKKAEKFNMFLTSTEIRFLMIIQIYTKIIAFTLVYKLDGDWEFVSSKNEILVVYLILPSSPL